MSLIVFTSININAQATSSNKDYSKQIEVLEILGVIQDIDARATDFSAKITRGDFANYVAALIKATENNEIPDSPYYYDVVKSHYAYAAVSILTEKGILNGVENKVFKPDEYILTADAYKILLAVMNYDMYISKTGGYPQGCVAVAQRLGLAENCGAGTYFTIGDMINALFNCLSISINDTSFISGNKVILSPNDNLTILSMYHNSYYKEGKVVVVEQVGIYGEYIEDVNKVKIDDIIYDNEYINFQSFLGQKIDFIYREDDDEKYTIIWASPHKSMDVLDIYPYIDDFEYDDETFSIKYSYQNEKSKRVNLESGYTLVYNDEKYSGDIKTIFENNLYSLRLIDGNNNGKYETIIAKAYRNILVETIDSKKFIIYGEDESSCILDSDSLKKVKIYNKNGAELSFEDLKVGDVVSVFESMSKDYVTAYVNDSVQTGVLKGTQEENNGNIILEINETAYLLTNPSLIEQIRLGSNVQFQMDAFSYIAKIETIKSELFAAYVLEIENVRVLEKDVQLKVLSDDGEINIYSMAKRVDIDGSKKTEAEVYKELSVNDVAKRQLVMLRLNDYGEISMIDTLDNPLPNTLKTDVVSTEVKYKTSLKKFYKSGDNENAGKIVLGDKTKIFTIPEESKISSAEDEDFDVITPNDIADNKEFDKVVSYKISDELEETAFLVIEGASWERLSDYILVESIKYVRNDEDEFVECITGYQGTSYRNYYGESGFSSKHLDIQPGDIICLRMNRSGEIIVAEKIYSKDSNQFYSTGDNLESKAYIRMGYIVDKKNHIVQVGYNSPDYFDEAFNFKGRNVVVFEENANEIDVEIGKFEDTHMNSFRQNGENCSVIFFFANYGAIKSIYVYKN